MKIKALQLAARCGLVRPASQPATATPDVATIFNWPARLQPRGVDAPLQMVDVMPTALALAWAPPIPPTSRSTARTSGCPDPCGHRIQRNNNPMLTK